MHASILFALLLLSTPTQQTPAPAPSASTVTSQQALTAALLGQWTGVLEYRDYSEPATSTKRIQLPTWLMISPAAEGLSLDYVYDDGPAKTVTDRDTLVLDLAQSRYRVVGKDTIEQYTISGADTLKDGHGTISLNGPGKDNDKPADIHITWKVRRNLLSWLEEVRPAGSSQSFVFRHLYTFTRAQPPAATK